MKIAIVDIETTGLDPQRHEIIEIGAVIFDDADFEIIDTIDLKVKPLYVERFMPEARKINGYNSEDWKDAITLQKAIEIFSEKTKGAIFCAHNVTFDWSFIEEASRYFNVPLFLDYKKLDTLSMAWIKIPRDVIRNSLSLKSLCQRFDIEPEPSIHRALNGAMCEFELYKKLNA